MAEELALHLAAMPDALRTKVETFVRRVFVHKGIYDLETGRKVAPPFDESELREALTIAAKEGAKLPGGTGQAAVDKVLNELGPWLFDPKVEPSLPTARPSLPGPFKPHIEPLLVSLKSATKIAKGESKTALEKLVRYLSSGDAAAFEAHLRAGASSELLALRIGFFETPLASRELLGRRDARRQVGAASHDQAGGSPARRARRGLSLPFGDTDSACSRDDSSDLDRERVAHDPARFVAASGKRTWSGIGVDARCRG